MAPSKTYNIPGLGCAFAVIPDAALRHRFRHALDGIVPHVNVLGLAACEAAYRDCGAWHRELIAYLAGNRDRVAATLGALPGAKASPVEATYLAWIDVRELGLAHPAAHSRRMASACPTAAILALRVGCVSISAAPGNPGRSPETFHRRLSGRRMNPYFYPCGRWPWPSSPNPWPPG